MALVINKTKTFKWSVEYEYPNDDDFVEVKFKAIFKRMPQSFIDDMAKKAVPKKDGTVDFDPTDLTRKVLVGWEEIYITNEQGIDVPLEFNKENLEQFLEIPLVTTFCTMAFYQGQTGSKLKNLQGQSTI